MDSERRASIRETKSANVLDAFGIPPEAGGGMPVICLTGNRYLCIERHRGALKLSPECIRLYTPCGLIRIEGKNLVVSDMDNERIRLCGFIRSLQFE